MPVRTFGVVEQKILAQPNHQFTHRGIAVEVDILVLDVAPQAFDKNVVKGPAASVHADLDLFALEYFPSVTTGFSPAPPVPVATSAPSPVYGERDVMVRFRVLDLLWKPVGRIVRFCIVHHPLRGTIFLLSTDTSLNAFRRPDL